jgi:HK97 family phage prohead protease
VSYESSLSVRASGDESQVNFLGIASAYERAYDMVDAFGPYSEIVSRGAGAKSLARTDLDVPLVLGHDPMRRIARTTNGTLTLRETLEGLEVNAPNLPADDADVAYITPKIRSGLIDEMSFAFRIVRGQWSPDFTTYRIEEFDIHRGDVSIVGFGANPYTSAEFRAQSGEDLIPVEETRLLLLPY